MTHSWLILADDLAGAADSAVAFAKKGIPSIVLFDSREFTDAGSTEVVAVDAASRSFPAQQAALIHSSLLERRFKKGMRLYRKIDSLMRGQPMAELAAALETLRKQDGPAFMVLAPAFPTTGRTIVGGRVFVDGNPLETTEVWAREHSYPTGNLMENLHCAGIRAQNISLEAVRNGKEFIAARVNDAMDQGLDGVVCDAETEDDLARIAEATYMMPHVLFWAGSGGLAASLARLDKPDRIAGPVLFSGTKRGLLLVVGSLAAISREALRFVLETEVVDHVSFTPYSLLSDRTAREARSRDIVSALLAGRDVVVEITSHPDLDQWGVLAGRLAETLHDALETADGLVVTGGETAGKLMAEAGILGIRLVTEVESGVPAGLALGRRSLPLVTKAGSFGTKHTLAHCLQYLRSANSKGELHEVPGEKNARLDV